jgi:uncharacterized protein (TIGR02001 family)
MKKILITLILLSSFHAFAEYEAEVGIYSNFIWRGTTFTENKPAIQADASWLDDSGIFIGSFLSNAEFNDPALTNDEVTQEWDYYVGYHHEFGELQADLSFNRYTFPNTTAYDTNDYNLKLYYLSWTFEFSYLDTYFGYKSTNRYSRLSYEFELPKETVLFLGVGYNHFSRTKGAILTRNGESTLDGGGPHYWDTYFSLKKDLKNSQAIELAYNWTNRKEFETDGVSTSKFNPHDACFLVAWTINIDLNN